jgi:hypothetical protein
MKFHIVQDGLIVCPHSEGKFSVGEIPDTMVDFVCHLIPGDRAHSYLPLLMASPELFRSCEELYHLCVSELDFPINSLALTNAKRAIEIAEGTLPFFGKWVHRIDFPCMSHLSLVMP